ncbi:ABC-three component system middle component 6 [Rhizobium leguminosarum]|jgi:hypothetical protein|uniref:ABC-three component system middle component 6 n=1 Tax=Rhizobium leguminosarum TaxID=384 RepID=UPI003F9C5605
MILPTKFLPAERSLIVLGGEIITMLSGYPRSVSEVWEGMSAESRKAPLTFDWFVLALDLLYAMSVIETDNGLLRIAKAAA